MTKFRKSGRLATEPILLQSCPVRALPHLTRAIYSYFFLFARMSSGCDLWEFASRHSRRKSPPRLLTISPESGVLTPNFRAASRSVFLEWRFHRRHIGMY